MERTLVIFKPDSVQRQVVGEILARFERAGLKVVGMKMAEPDEKLLESHYTDDLIPILGEKTLSDWGRYGIATKESKEELGRKILASVRDFLGSGPVIALVLEGGHSVEIVRKMVGSTGPKDSAPGTIRGDYAHLSLGRASAKGIGAPNLIHASGTPDEAEREIKLWFSPSELFEYKTANEHFTHA